MLDGQTVHLMNGEYYSIRSDKLIWHHSGDRIIVSNTRSDDYECLILAFLIRRR